MAMAPIPPVNAASPNCAPSGTGSPVRQPVLASGRAMDPSSVAAVTTSAEGRAGWQPAWQAPPQAEGRVSAPRPRSGQAPGG
jgi:hypothetical protein